MEYKTKINNRNISEIIDLFSDEILPKDIRQQVTNIYNNLDQLLFIDQFHQLAVDRENFIKIASDKTLIPTVLRDIVVLETAKHLGKAIKRAAKGYRIYWSEGEKYGLPNKVMQKADVMAMGISESTKLKDLEKIVKLNFEIPEFMLEKNPEKLRENFIQKFLDNRTVWDCLYANLGWWAVISLVGSLITFLCLLTVNVCLAIVCACIFFGVTTLYFVLQCACNPYYIL